MLIDREIAELCVGATPMIYPFVSCQVREQVTEVRVGPEKVVSYGLSSCGYDIRLDDEFVVFAPRYDRAGVVDPKSFDDCLTRKHSGTGDCLIPPNSYVLARSLERFRIPETIVADVVGKSTYARCGIIVNVTPLEPGWEGVLTIEISNASPLPALIYANEGIAQVRFFRLSSRPDVTYDDRGGKYQNQEGIETAKL